MSKDETIGDPRQTRRSFLAKTSLVGAASLLPLAKFVKSASAEEVDDQDTDIHKLQLVESDRKILTAASIAEALAVTTYSNIINNSPFFTRLPDDDQGYLLAAVQEEMSHYALEVDATGKPSPFTEFFYPAQMFADPQTTLDILVTLEDAFIAAYLVGVRHFSTANLRVTAARIMGIESDHRTLARVLAGDVSEQDGGPITQITGLQGVVEDADPPNNNGYERTQEWASITQAVDALLPFVDATSAQKAGFDSSKSFPFEPFTPTLPSDLGDFISFKG